MNWFWIWIFVSIPKKDQKIYMHINIITLGKWYQINIAAFSTTKRNNRMHRNPYMPKSLNWWTGWMLYTHIIVGLFVYVQRYGTKSGNITGCATGHSDVTRQLRGGDCATAWADVTRQLRGGDCATAWADVTRQLRVGYSATGHADLGGHGILFCWQREETVHIFERFEHSSFVCKAPVHRCQAMVRRRSFWVECCTYVTHVDCADFVMDRSSISTAWRVGRCVCVRKKVCVCVQEGVRVQVRLMSEKARRDTRTNYQHIHLPRNVFGLTSII